MPKSAQPDWIIISNFSSFRIYDLNQELPEDRYIEVSLVDIPTNMNLFEFIRSERTTRIYKEQQLSVEAGFLVTRLYSALAAEYGDPSNTDEERRSLNALVTRVVFLLYAEDAGLLPSFTAFSDYCDGPVANLRSKLIDIFKVVDTPLSDRGSLYVDPLLKEWPYINGGLFHDDPESTVIVPWIENDEVKNAILDASEFDWSGISPTIFGAVFESTLNPRTSTRGGLHYTSVENIHRAIGPLFLEELEAEFSNAKSLPSIKTRNMALNRLHNKIASIRILDPACGSGNFLTESYLQLRSLENKIISLQLEDGVTAPTAESLVRVTIDHFYGIEINDFAVSVARTALWISEQQALDETLSIAPNVGIDYLPLKSTNRIIEANAFSFDWSELLPSNQCTYIVGNPEFCGAKKQTESQRADVERVFGERKKIDYCSAWFLKAAEYMGPGCRAALVATDSICQGEQVAIVWQPLLTRGIHIDFAHNTFQWDNEAADVTHVYCVVIGFSRETVRKRLYIHSAPDSEAVTVYPQRINPYLRDSADVLVSSRTRPICAVPEMRSGNKPIDNGNYLFTYEEMNEFIRKEPAAAKLFRPYVGGDEMLNGFMRWCLWLGDTSDRELLDLPMCRERVENVRRFRLASTDAGTRRLAQRPTRFHVEVMPQGSSAIIPETSSERRRYIPIGFASPGTLCSNQTKLIPDASLYHFGVLQSQFHNAWMRAVAGRHEGRYRYSKNIVYNNFIWPDPDERAKKKIEDAAEKVLSTRESHRGLNLGDMYSRISLDYESSDFTMRQDAEHNLDDLLEAHRELDSAVEQAYGVSFGGDESRIIDYLFEKYSVWQRYNRQV